MRLVPIYLNPASVSVHDRFRATLHVLGVPVKNLRESPRGAHYSFDPRQGWAQPFGLVLAPDGSRYVDGVKDRLLEVPVPEGTVRLSAADVVRQAGVDGCGLTWTAGLPAAWPGRAS